MGEARKLGTSSLIYLIPSLLARGLNVLLTPLYVRVMSTGEYGVVGLATTALGLWTMLIGLSLASSFSRMHFECKGEKEQRELYGTILFFLLIFATAITIVTDVVLRATGFEPFTSLPFHPYLELVLWSALFYVFHSLPVLSFAAKEQPLRSSAMNVLSTVVQVGFNLVFVLWLRQGALGMVRALFWSSLVIAVVSIVVMARQSMFRISKVVLKGALLFGLPLIPHSLANWVLAISDRVILERNVSKSELGTYTLAYMFALIAFILINAFWSAFAPMAQRQLKDPATAPNVPRHGTYVLVGMMLPTLATAALAREAILLVTPPAYHEAVRFVPWVVFGSGLQGIYYIWSLGTLFSMKTKLYPIVTAIGAGVNVGLNVLLVPRYGAFAAAVNTAVAYGLLALMHGWLAQKNYPIKWEYRRWGMLFAITGVIWTACWLAESLPLGVTIAVKLVLLIVGFPALLALTRFATPAEIQALRKLLGSRFSRSSA